MAFSKKTYTSGQTAITADNLNAIQDELIRVGGAGTLPVADYVVEQGTSGIWHYRKWSSGTAECWGEVTVRASITDAIGSMYMKVTDYFSWPNALFSSAPKNTLAAPVTTAPLLPIIRGGDTTKNQFRMYLLYPERYENTVNWVIGVEAKGRWK